MLEHGGRSYGARATTAGVVLAAAAFLAGCGDQQEPAQDAADRSSASVSPDSPTTSTTPTPEDAPPCAEVWQVGERLPRFYRGCVDDTGAYVERDALGCSSGQRLVRHADRYYAVLGGEIKRAKGPLEKHEDYVETVRICRG